MDVERIANHIGKLSELNIMMFNVLAAIAASPEPFDARFMAQRALERFVEIGEKEKSLANT